MLTNGQTSTLLKTMPPSLHRCYKHVFLLSSIFGINIDCSYIGVDVNSKCCKIAMVQDVIGHSSRPITRQKEICRRPCRTNALLKPTERLKVLGVGLRLYSVRCHGFFLQLPACITTQVSQVQSRRRSSSMFQREFYYKPLTS